VGGANARQGQERPARDRSGTTPTAAIDKFSNGLSGKMNIKTPFTKRVPQLNLFQGFAYGVK
jgi:hypothetical protein